MIPIVTIALPGLTLHPERPLAPLEAAMFILNQREDALLHACEDGTLPWVWDIATPTSERRELRILSESLTAIACQKPQPKYDDVEDVISELVPHRDLKSTELQVFLTCSSTHVSNLLRAGCLAAVAPRKAESGVHSATWVRRDSVVEFLRSRRFSG